MPPDDAPHTVGTVLTSRTSLNHFRWPEGDPVKFSYLNTVVFMTSEKRKILENKKFSLLDSLVVLILVFMTI